jgi:hypothetical protein
MTRETRARRKDYTVAECIHGFEGGLCDICFPKAVVERPRTVRSAATPRRTAGVTTTRKTINLGDQRIYHLTHVRNLDNILETGELRADATPTINLSTDLTRELRLTAEVVPGESVGGYVPFYLSPDATLWQQLRGGASDETRWSAAARAAASGDFIFLVSTAKALGDDGALADGDAAATLTRFASGADTGRMLVRLHDEARLQDAEALAKESFAFDSVQLIGVANDPMRERVRGMLDAANFATKVAVYPPWFLPAV